MLRDKMQWWLTYVPTHHPQASKLRTKHQTPTKVRIHCKHSIHTSTPESRSRNIEAWHDIPFPKTHASTTQQRLVEIRIHPISCQSRIWFWYISVQARSVAKIVVAVLPEHIFVMSLKAVLETPFGIGKYTVSRTDKCMPPPSTCTDHWFKLWATFPKCL